MHHAWLLTGTNAPRAREFAQAAAAELVGEQRGTGDYHPDILHLKREAKEGAGKGAEEGKPTELTRSITVAQIRKLQQRLEKRPTVGTMRAVLVDTMDDLEKAAVNAMLKCLEEPPAGTVFFLISEHPAKLLPTIRSRCRTLRLPAEDSIRGAAHELDQPVVAAIAHTLSSLHEHLGGQSSAAHQLLEAIGTRPSANKLQTIVEAALAEATKLVPAADRNSSAALAAVSEELRRLQGELLVYNYDADLMAARLATLLTSVGSPTAASNG